MNSFAVDAVPLVRVLAAIGLGAMIGFEREANDQAAGLRTHISVALGACVFGVISTLGFEAYEQTSTTNVQVDVTRVASQVVVGIGFIGAGVIFRHGATVRNLTTAASLWVTAAIGLAAGVGDIGLAVVATVGLVASLAVLRLPRRWIRRNITKTAHEVRIRLRPGAGSEPVERMLRALDGVDVKAIRTERQSGDVVLHLVLEVSPHADADALLAAIATRDDITDLGTAFDREPPTD